MKKLIIIFFLLLSCDLYAPGRHEFVILRTEPIQPYEALWRAVCMVESSGNPYAINESEQAHGIAQIRQIRLDDYAQRTGVVYTLEDCFDKKIAKSIFSFYCSGSLEEIAKSWNGSGRLTEKYWQKVQQYL